MAITAHYMIEASDGSLRLRSTLIAFRRLQGSHDGENLAKVFMQVLKEVGATERVSVYKILSIPLIR